MRVCLMLLLFFYVIIPNEVAASDGGRKRLTVQQLRGIEAATGKRRLNRHYLKFLNSRHAERKTYAGYWYRKQRIKKNTGILLAGLMAPIAGIATVAGTVAMGYRHDDLVEKNKEDGDSESSIILNTILGVVVGVLGSCVTIAFIVGGINLCANGRNGMDRLNPFMPKEQSGHKERSSSNPIGQLLTNKSTAPGLCVVINF